jgi:hypothetical protein
MHVLWSPLSNQWQFDQMVLNAEEKEPPAMMISLEKHTSPSGIVSLTPAAKRVVLASTEQRSHMTCSTTCPTSCRRLGPWQASSLFTRGWRVVGLDTQNTQGTRSIYPSSGFWALHHHGILRVSNAQSRVYNRGIEREFGRGLCGAILGFLVVDTKIWFEVRRPWRQNLSKKAKAFSRIG